MTALAGVWRFDGGPDAAMQCKRMLTSQANLGPHSTDKWSDGEIAIGRQLFRLLPEDDFDRQPLVGAEGRFALVADLRLDNRDELARLLEISTPDASHLCDAMVLLAAFERWGERCVDRLVGDFAFAVWDRKEHRLILARDPCGQRPLFFHRGQDFFAFSSMPKGLHALAEVPYELDEESIAEALVPISISGTRTFYQGIERVLSGHTVSISPNAITSQRYWSPGAQKVTLKNLDEYCEGVRAHLDQAVRCRLRGVGDVGTELSGGLDSSAVTATAARALGESGRGLIAFTAVPRPGYNYGMRRNRLIDEGPHAAVTAAMYHNIEHVLVHSDGKSPLDLFQASLFLGGGPAGAPCNAVWGNNIMNAARERKLTVLLNGQMGNMGMSYHGMQLLPELFQSGHWLRLLREVRALVSRRELHWRGALLKTLGPWCPAPIWVLIHRLLGRSVASPGTNYALNPRLISELDLVARAKKDRMDPYYRPWKNKNALLTYYIGHSDWGSSNKGVLEGWGIDRRDPTSDIRLLEFCLAIPTEMYLRDGVPRTLARQAFADRLPALVTNETRKGYQAADWHEVLTADRPRIASEIDRLASCSAAERLLDLPRMRRLVKDWPKDGWEREDVILSYRVALVASLAMGDFVRRVSGSNA